MPEAVPTSPLAGAVLADNPLSVSHRRELAAARDRAKTIRKAARVAGFNGWTTAAAAAGSGMFLVFDRSAVAIAITLGLSVVAYVEFRGRKKLLNFDPSAATMLGWNQLGLLATIIVYCLWMLYSNLNGANPLADLKSNPEIGEVLGGSGHLEDLFRQIVVAFYGLVILLSVVFQGANAWYYFTRRQYIETYLAETPAWVRELQIATASL